MVHKIIGIDYDAHDDCVFALGMVKIGNELIEVRPFVWYLFVPLPTTSTATDDDNYNGHIATNPAISNTNS